MSWWVPALRPSIAFGLKLDKELNENKFNVESIKMNTLY